MLVPGAAVSGIGLDALDQPVGGSWTRMIVSAVRLPSQTAPGSVTTRGGAAWGGGGAATGAAATGGGSGRAQLPSTAANTIEYRSFICRTHEKRAGGLRPRPLLSTER